MISVALFGFGLVLGSFFNVCIDRVPKGNSVVRPPSHCDACGHLLAWRDLIPVISYLLLRGRCRYCGACVSWRVPAVEVATGLLFAGLGLVVGWSASLIPALVYSSLFLVVLVIDLETQTIPNRLILPAIPLVWLLSTMWPPTDASRSMLSVLPGPLVSNGLVMALLQSLAGGLVAFLIMLLPFLLYPEGMGGGDVKLAAVVGLATGFPLSLLALFISFLGGGIIGGALLLSGAKGRKDPIPFGPFLSVAAVVALIWGDELAGWYWHSLTY